jgi:hypothetical protein
MGQAAVTDGDTIAIHKQCIRLWAVDASEANRSRIKQPKLWCAMQNEPTNSYTIEIACILSDLNGSAVVGADFGLTRCRSASQHVSRQRAP